MPRRKRAQEAKRAAKRMLRATTERTARTIAREEDEYERTWREHQAYERHRRAPAALDAQMRRAQARARTTQQVRDAIRVVEADFARWRKS